MLAQPATLPARVCQGLEARLAQLSANARPVIELTSLLIQRRV
jgi:hypothetical protein